MLHFFFCIELNLDGRIDYLLSIFLIYESGECDIAQAATYEKFHHLILTCTFFLLLNLKACVDFYSYFRLSNKKKNPQSSLLFMVH